MNAQPDWGIANAASLPLGQKADARRDVPFPEDIERELVRSQSQIPSSQVVHAWRAGAIDVGTDAEGRVWVKMTKRQAAAFKEARRRLG